MDTCSSGNGIWQRSLRAQRYLRGSGRNKRHGERRGGKTFVVHSLLYKGPVAALIVRTRACVCERVVRCRRL